MDTSELKFGRRYEYSALSNVTVIDGDSFRVDIDVGLDLFLRYTDIRLARYDAPEVSQRKGYAPNHRQAGLAVTRVVNKWFTMVAARECVLTLHSEYKIKLEEHRTTKDLFGRLIGDFSYTEGGSAKYLSYFLTNNGLVQELDTSGRRRPWKVQALADVITNATAAQSRLSNIIRASTK